MKRIIVILVISFLVIGCGSDEMSNLDEVISSGNYIILDVRTNEEYNVGHVKGSLNIPYDEIDENINLDKNKVILVYCRSGVRSKKAFSALKSLGYNVIDMGSYESINLEKE